MMGLYHLYSFSIIGGECDRLVVAARVPDGFDDIYLDGVRGEEPGVYCIAGDEERMIKPVDADVAEYLLDADALSVIRLFALCPRLASEHSDVFFRALLEGNDPFQPEILAEKKMLLLTRGPLPVDASPDSLREVEEVPVPEWADALLLLPAARRVALAVPAKMGRGYYLKKRWKDLGLVRAEVDAPLLVAEGGEKETKVRAGIRGEYITLVPVSVLRAAVKA